jgi:predicted Zn-dependent peptidase
MVVNGAPELIRLANGVRIALDPMPGLETVALGVWIRVGARWERPDQNGVAHLFEHMAFKGAGSRDARALAEAIESVGAVMNAATSYERTAYFARALKRDAAFVFSLLADIVLAPRWLEDDFEREKGVVAQERGEAYDQPDDRIFELHQAAVFPDQPLGRPVLGREETLAPLTVAALEGFRDLHYAPDRIVIAAAGGFERDALVDIAEKRFGAMARVDHAAPPAAAPKRGMLFEPRRLEQCHFVRSWAAPAAGEDAIYAARLLCEIYGGGMASRLFQDVRETRGLVYAIDSYLDAYEDVGRLGVYAGCAPANVAVVADRAGAIMGELSEKGPTEEEMARAKVTLAAQTVMGAEGPAARAESSAGQAFLRDRLVPLEEVRRRIEAVTVEDVRMLAAQALAGPAAAAVIGPKRGLKSAEAHLARFV